MGAPSTRRSALALLLIGTAAVTAALATESLEEERRCCFNHRAHSGTCVVVPAEGESCADILRWLNDPNSSGKTYCNNTPLRGGWQQVKCESGASARSDCRDR